MLNVIGFPVKIKGNLFAINCWGILKIDVKKALHISDKYRTKIN